MEGVLLIRGLHYDIVIFEQRWSDAGGTNQEDFSNQVTSSVATDPLKLYKPLPPKVRRILHADRAWGLRVQECWIFGSGHWGSWGSVVNLFAVKP